MYTYKLYLFVTYLLTFRWTFCSTGSEATTEKTTITFDLSKLKEHGPVDEEVDNAKYKATTFTTPDTKVVDKVVYDGANVWVSSASGGKVLKKLVAIHRNDIPQLLHLVLTTTGSAAQDENVYYKKGKTQFTGIQDEEYKRSKSKLFHNTRHYVNEWYPMDFARSELYSGSTNQQQALEDGVLKTTYTPLRGTSISVVKNGTTTMWTHSEEAKKVTSLELLEFGNDNFLLTISIGADNEYFHKSGADATWTKLENLSAFKTKVTAFKSNYFAEKIEYDLSGPPNKEHFYIKRNPDRNYSYLTLNVYRKYYLGNVKYKGTSLWTGEKNTRALYLNLDLLYHEVKTFQVIYSVVPAGSVPDKKAAYFFKDTDGAFKQVAKKKPDFTNHVNKVKAAIDGRTPFVYNETWPNQPKPLDLNNFNSEDLTVAPSDLGNGATQKTLTAKDRVPFNRLDFRGTVVWPTNQHSVIKPNVKEVVVVYKNSLLQFVHLKAMAVAVPPRGGPPTTNTPTEFNLYFKKEEERFRNVANNDEFVRLKNALATPSQSQSYDTFVHLDLNQETLDAAVYEVTTEYVDGVTKKVVKPKANIKVIKLFSYNTDIWSRSQRLYDYVLRKYELYSYGDKKVLKLYTGGFHDPHHTTEEYHEKRDSNVAWTRCYTNFDDKLRELKLTAVLSPLELDVSVKPTTDYNVEVKSLSGNKTKLVLTPVEGKKITSVKHGTHVFFTADNNRAHKVELYLEEYVVKFVKVFVWKDVPHSSPLLTEEKHFKDAPAAGTTWTSTNFDAKLREFETTASTVPFTYSPDWVLPSMTFDPKTSHRFYFQSSDQTDGLVTTTTYTPKEGTVVNNVLYDRSKVWPANEDGSGDTAKKLVHLKVLSKNDMVQLLQLRNALVATPNTTEDLYYKKVMDTYVKLDSENAFNDLKGTLSKEDTYVDQNVKLDLSSTEETSTKLFEKETTLEDGVEKTVVVVKAGKLFQVSASPPLWTSTDGSYVTKLERYVLDMTQFLVLHITKSTGGQETKFFEKPVRAPEPPPGPSGEPSRPDASQTTEEQRRQTEQQQQDSQAQQQSLREGVPVPQPPPATPSFASLGGIDAFVAKLNQAKASVRHEEVPLDVAAYSGDNNFEVKEVEEGTTRLFKVYPKKTFWVTRLLNTSGVELWAKKADGERLVEVFLYLHDTTLRFVKAVVWPKDRTNSSHDKFLHFKLENGKLVERTADQFAKELEELTKVPPTPLSTEKYAPPEPIPYFFYKLYLSDRVDTDIFEFTETNAGAYKLKKYAAKQHKFVNAVETQHGLLWKAEDNQDHMKSTFFAVTENSALARLTLSVNSQPMDMFFKFEDDRWHNLNSKTYGELYAKAGLPSS